MASEENKPDGLKKLESGQVKGFLEGRNVRELHGVGSKTAEKLEKIGIETVDQLRETNGSRLVGEFGQSKTASLKARSKGRGSDSINSEDQKQISKIKTMERNSKNPRYILKELEMVANMLIERVEKKQKAFQKISLIVIDTELETYTRSKSLKTSKSKKIIIENSEKMLRDLLAEEAIEIRRIGLRVSKLVDRKSQTDLKQFRN